MSQPGPSCLDIVLEARETAEQRQAADDRYEDQAAQRAPYNVVGIRWINHAIYYEVDFQETVIGQKRFLELTESLPEHTWVQWKELAVSEGVGWQSGFPEPILRVKWRSASFKINEIDPSKALRLLQDGRLHQQMSCLPLPKRLFYWTQCEHYDTVIVDGMCSRLYREQRQDVI